MDLKKLTYEIESVNFEISLRWTVDDVINRAEKLGAFVEYHVARKMLEHMKKDHRDEGITWDRIDLYIDAWRDRNASIC